MTPSRPLRTAACLLSALVLTASALAQDVRHYRAGETVDPLEVAAILGGRAAAGEPAIKMRSIRLLDGPAAVAAAPAASGLSLQVQFAFDSADILPAAREQLDAMAEGIRLLPAGKPVVIEGHTDGVGSADYNEQLSLRRANAVKRYLVAAHQLDSGRLRTVGMGESAPRPGSDPNDAVNRRVQFHGD
jgi:outer membrane protein OmpA-like peptidoglycan-associated protein